MILFLQLLTRDTRSGTANSANAGIPYTLAPQVVDIIAILLAIRFYFLITLCFIIYLFFVIIIINALGLLLFFYRHSVIGSGRRLGRRRRTNYTFTHTHARARAERGLNFTVSPGTVSPSPKASARTGRQQLSHRVRHRLNSEYDLITDYIMKIQFKYSFHIVCDLIIHDFGFLTKKANKRKRNSLVFLSM